MTTEPHRHDSVEMPEPTIAPLVLSLGMALFAAGLIMGSTFLFVGAVILLYGLGMWISNLLPGRGHMHEALASPDKRPQPIKPVLGAVRELRPGMVGYRVRLPEKMHPISAGIKGGLAAALIMPLPVLVYGIFSGHGVWYAGNLLAGMVLPGLAQLSVEELEAFHFGYFIIGLIIHVVVSVVFGLIYGVLLPTLPAIPQAMAWGAVLAPLLWGGTTYYLTMIANPEVNKSVQWEWFFLTQFIYGVVMTLVVIEATDLSPVMRGGLGGLLGGVLMPIPAVLWSLGAGKGFFYPVNLLAGFLMPVGDRSLTEFHADWFVLASVLHLAASVGFGVACALLMPKLKPIPSALAWGGLLMPILWTETSYGLMGVLNPVLQQRVDWPSFIVAQFVFGVVAAVVVMRTEQIDVQPAGTGK